MTQAEADGLTGVLKRILSTGYFWLPQLGENEQIDLVSVFNKQDTFIIDVRRPSKIRTEKYTLQLRYRKDTVLLRLEFAGPPHQNPDDEVVPCPHIHIWRERSGSQNTGWAFPLPVIFSNPDDFVRTLKEFLQYSNVGNHDELSITEQTHVNN